MDYIEMRVCFIKRRVDRIRRHLKGQPEKDIYGHPFDEQAKNRLQQLYDIIGVRNEEQYNIIAGRIG